MVQSFSIRNREHHRSAAIGHRGFTLVELMISVAIAGVLASVAIPSYRRYLEKARSSEAAARLGEMSAYVRTYFVSRRSIPCVGSRCDPGAQSTAGKSALADYPCVPHSRADVTAYLQQTRADNVFANALPLALADNVYFAYKTSILSDGNSLFGSFVASRQELCGGGAGSRLLVEYRATGSSRAGPMISRN